MITTLEKKPHLLEATLLLIEKAFCYPSTEKFSVDFYPLMNITNQSRNYIYIEDGEVLAHIGCLIRHFKVGTTQHRICMYGGIAVREDQQGRGLFKSLFEHALEENSKVALHFLWSEKVNLYKKFSFYPCVELNQYSQEKSKGDTTYKIKKTKLANLKASTFLEVQNLYCSSLEVRQYRSPSHWEDLKKITTSELFLVYNEDLLINYFFMGKGADLNQTIHEYGHIDQSFLKLMRNFGNVWTPSFFIKEGRTTLFGSVVRAGDEDLFTSFIHSFAKVSIKSARNIIRFSYKGELFEDSVQDFLQGIFGPGKYPEIQTRALFISGLDSI